MRTPYDVLCSKFCASWTLTSRKDDGEDYTFDLFYGLLIKAQEKFIDEGKSTVKKRAHLLKSKV